MAFFIRGALTVKQWVQTDTTHRCLSYLINQNLLDTRRRDAILPIGQIVRHRFVHQVRVERDHLVHLEQGVDLPGRGCSRSQEHHGQAGHGGEGGEHSVAIDGALLI